MPKANSFWWRPTDVTGCLRSRGAWSRVVWRGGIRRSPANYACRSEVDASGAFQLVKQSAEEVLGLWSDTTGERTYPEGYQLTKRVAEQGAGERHATSRLPRPRPTIAWRWNREARFPGPTRNTNSTAWTRRTLTKPGGAAILPDIEALSDVVVRGGFAQVGSGSPGAEVSLFSGEASPSWHGAVSSADTGSLLTSANLPPPNKSGIVQQPDQFIWFTRDRFEAGGPITKWADVFASAAGQWALQTVPLASLGTNQGSQMLFGDVRSRIRVSAKDQLDLLYSGSRVSLSDGGVPANLVDLMSRRMAPSFVLPGGFQNESEADEFNYLQAGWTHELPAASNLGLVQVRYGYSMVHLNTTPLQQAGTPQQSSIELLGGMVTGAPPLADLATRMRQEVTGAWVLDPLQIGSSSPSNCGRRGMGRFIADRPRDHSFRHELGYGERFGGFRRGVQYAAGQSRSRCGRRLFRSPTTPPSRTTYRSTSGPSPTFHVARCRRSPALRGSFAPARTFAAQPDLIAWNSISPRAGFAWVVPHAHHLLCSGRLFPPARAAGGQISGLRKSEQSRQAANTNGTISTAMARSNPGNKEPCCCASEGLIPRSRPRCAGLMRINSTSASNLPLGHWGQLAMCFSIRRYEKRRLAALDTGVPPGAFTPVTITDPGDIESPAGATRTRRLRTKSRYLWAGPLPADNPPGLGTLNGRHRGGNKQELEAVDVSWLSGIRRIAWPTNPGDGVFRE